MLLFEHVYTFCFCSSISTATNWSFNLIVAMTFLFLTQWLTRCENSHPRFHLNLDVPSWLFNPRPGVVPSIFTPAWRSLAGSLFYFSCQKPRGGQCQTPSIIIISTYYKSTFLGSYQEFGTNGGDFLGASCCALPQRSGHCDRMKIFHISGKSNYKEEDGIGFRHIWSNEGQNIAYMELMLIPKKIEKGFFSLLIFITSQVRDRILLPYLLFVRDRHTFSPLAHTHWIHNNNHTIFQKILSSCILLLLIHTESKIKSNNI